MGVKTTRGRASQSAHPRRTRAAVASAVSVLALSVALLGSGGGVTGALAGGHHNHGNGGGNQGGGNNQRPPHNPPERPHIPPGEEPFNPLQPIAEKSDHYIPKPAGTKETIRFWYGPYVVPPGWDANRVDLDIPGRQRDGDLDRAQPAHGARRHGALAPGSRTSTTRTGSASTPAARTTTTPTGSPTGCSATATRRRRPTSTSARRRPEAGRSTAATSAHRAAADDLHAAQQDLGSRSSPTSCSTSPSSTGRSRSSTRCADRALPRHHRHPFRPHLRRPARPEEQGRHLRDRPRTTSAA